MAYNFGNATNSALDNFHIFGNLASNAAALVSNPNYINQLAAAITTVSGIGGSISVEKNGTNNLRHREKTPEAPPAPKLTAEQMRRIKPNQGTAPMDIENDEPDYEIVVSRAHNSATTTTTTATKTSKNTNATTKNDAEKINSTSTTSMTDANLFLNNLIPAPTSYMFFPASNASAANNATMLMDPTTTAMMAAAMQQMQQAYPGFAIPTENTGGNAAAVDGSTGAAGSTMKEMIKTKHCILFPPNPDAPPPTIRERPPGCRTVFVGGLPENITEEIIREIFESCGEITTLRMSKKNFCHIRYRNESCIDHAIYLSGYRLRIADASDPMNYGRLHVDYAQARDDQYDYECKQRQLLREQRHRERMALDRSQSPPPIPHYTDHEASLVSEHLRSNETFLKSVQTITIWLERGDCTKRNANAFYSMIQSTHAHVRRLYSDKQVLEQDLRKARESYRKQMLTMSTQFTQIEKVFSAASHKKVWDHFTKAQRKNIDQWKKLASELRSVQIEDDEMEMSDDDRDSHCSSTKKARYDSDSLKEENDSLRCQIDAMRNEMFINRSELRQDSDFREKQIKVLQETIRNLQTQLLQTKMREQKDAKSIEQLERELKEARVKTLLLQTKIKETRNKQKECKIISSSSSACSIDEENSVKSVKEKSTHDDNELKNVETESNKRTQLETKETSINLINFKEAKTQVDHQCQENILLANKAGNTSDDDDEDVRFIDIKQQEKQDFNRAIQCSKLKDVNVVVLVEEDLVTVDLENAQKNDQEAKAVITANHEETETNRKVENEVTELKELEIFKDSVTELKSKTEEFQALEQLEARIIALVAAYLVVQPFGASSSSICAYLSSFIKMNHIQEKTLDEILGKYENLFKTAETIEVEDKAKHELELKWKFCGFIAT